LSDHKLILGDCLDELPKIFDKNIDLILTDPPYGTTQCKWDSVIPFEPMWNQLKRVIKDNGCIALFGSEPFSSYLRTSNIKWFKYDWVWNKVRPVGVHVCKYRPMSKNENISIFGKGKITFYPQMIDRKKLRKGSKEYGRTNIIGGKLGNKKIKIYTKKYPTTILEFSNASNKGRIHPTQKPVALLEYLIKTYTNENDTVLDFTMGSGSTGVACKNLNRNFIGIEKDENYYNIAKQRIEGVLI
jgi:site-specific DNA-methyltransferase (adenine-specific)